MILRRKFDLRFKYFPKSLTVISLARKKELALDNFNKKTRIKVNMDKAQYLFGSSKNFILGPPRFNTSGAILHSKSI